MYHIIRWTTGDGTDGIYKDWFGKCKYTISPEKRLMMKKYLYNYDELVQLMEKMRSIYDLVRIVDPEECREISISTEGELSVGNLCYSTWDTAQRCKNCSSYKACMSGTRVEKTEIHNNNTYHVLVIPVDFIIANGVQVTYAMECITVTKGVSNIGGTEKARFDKENDVSLYDYKTNLFNFEGFLKHTREFINRKPDVEKVIIAYNVRGFKVINEMYGKATATEVLMRMATILRGKCDDDEVCARIKGDQFAICIKKEKFSTEFIHEGMEYVSELFEEGAYRFFLQAGVYYITENDIPVAAMYDRAMLANSVIHDDNNKKFAFYDDSLMEKIIHEQNVINNFEKTLKNGQFKIFLQPQVNEYGRVHGAEALVRWIQPSGDIIPPMDFIGVLEKTELITVLDKYVWEEAVKQLAAWKGTDNENYYISVNISPKDFFHLDLYEFFTQLVEKYDVEKSKLKLEITESVLMNDEAKQISVINKLHKAGFEIEIDDFGKGYSSLSLLKDIDADVIKIDREFLRESENLLRSERILDSIITMSDKLDMKVITEGVETKEQLDKLIRLGCNTFQGFYFARPMPVEEFEQIK
ncbi:MAG: EAL domain-containing protein [Lachnospiraceae bacterium]|nr:EAL domain-containing protein [Lachnospiraceae bacterium]